MVNLNLGYVCKYTLFFFCPYPLREKAVLYHFLLKAREDDQAKLLSWHQSVDDGLGHSRGITTQV